MGEEPKKEPAAAAAAKPEEKKEEEKAEEEKKEPKPPSPFVLYVDLHCVGCAKKIEKSLLKIRGVEGVMIDMAQNQVTIKGVVDPQAVCTKIVKKTKRRARVLMSPLPSADDHEGEPAVPEEVVNNSSQVISEITTVELNVNMHCEACAEQLKRKILKMRGVRTATTEPSSGKVTVTGTIDANSLVDYVYRRTKKQAKIVPQPKPAEKPAESEAKPQQEEKNKEAEKPAGTEERPKPEDDKKEEGEKAPEEEKNDGGGGEGNSTNNKEEAKKEGEDDQQKKKISSSSSSSITDEQTDTMLRMKLHYQPLYVIERIPPPQLFSDENPNACCIT